MLKTTETLLEQWGRWVWTGRVTPGYTSPHWALIRDNIETPKSAPVITDAVAVSLDKVVARLKHREPALGNAVISRYMFSMSYHDIGRRIKRDKNVARQYVQSGLAWIDGVWHLGDE